MHRPRLAPPEVVCAGLSKTFGSGRSKIAALGLTDITFAAGKTTALVGPSGCGKSTLLRLIAGLETPTSGSVTIGGMTPLDVRKQAGLAMAFQDASLLPWRTVRGNVALARKLGRLKPDHQAVDNLIDLVGLIGFETRRPAELSGGMRQRVAIARCLVSEPGLLLLDEPFGAVDELTRARLNSELPELWERRGTTTLLVTNSVSEAVSLSDRVIVFSPRPAQIVADLEIAFDDRHAPDLSSTPEFRRYISAIMDSLHESAQPQVLAAE